MVQHTQYQCSHLCRFAHPVHELHACESARSRSAWHDSGEHTCLYGHRVLLTNCTLANGGITSDDSLILVTDSTVTGAAPGANTISAFGSSSVVLTRVQVNGAITLNQGANAQLLGVTQTTSLNNLMDDSAYVRIGDASPASGGPPSIPSTLKGFVLRNFSKATLLQSSNVSGNLNCSQGADAFCTTPANVSGTSNCGQCPKP